MILRIFSCLFFTLTCSSAFGSMVSYSTVEQFHESKINSILEEYGLKDRAKITFSLSSSQRKKNVENEIIKLPGLLLDAISLNTVKKETGLVEIIDALSDYKRKITILKTDAVTDKEIAVVTQALTEELYIKNQKSFTVKNWNAKKTGVGKLYDSLYSDVLTSPWALIGLLGFGVAAFLLFSLSSSILNGFTNLGKSIYEGIENSVGSSDSNSSSNTASDLAGTSGVGGLQNDSATSTSEGLDALRSHQSVDCQAIFKLMQTVYQAKPNEFKYKLWESFPDVNQQLNLFVYFESKLSQTELMSFSTFYKGIFKMESSEQAVDTGGSSSNLEVKLWNLRVVLTHMLVSPMDKGLEDVLGTIMLDFVGQTDEIIKGSVDKHFKVMSYVFQDKVNDFIGNQAELDDELSHKIINFLSLSEQSRLPNDIEVRSFETHLRENSHFKVDSNSTTSYRNIVVLQRLPDHVLFAEKSFDAETRQALNLQIPNFKWIRSSDQKTHKKFVTSLKPNEAAHFIKYYSGYMSFKEELDSRSVSRLQEMEIKSTQSNSVEIVLGLRGKIKRFYQPVEEIEVSQEILSAA